MSEFFKSGGKKEEGGKKKRLPAPVMIFSGEVCGGRSWRCLDSSRCGGRSREGGRGGGLAIWDRVDDLLFFFINK